MIDHLADMRQDTTVVIHTLDNKGKLVAAHPDFQLVISGNLQYQRLLKNFKQSTKQRFTGFDFDYPARI